MKIKCAIIDDEPLASGLFKSYVETTSYLSLDGIYGSAWEALRGLRERPVQLIFLDIQMPDLSGLELAKLLPKETKIIFTTAFQQYALEGYKVSAIDYIMKPISYEDFIKATNKALEWFGMSKPPQAYISDRFMYVKSDYQLIRVCLDNILYIEGLKDYVRISLDNGEKVLSLMNLRKMEDNLPHPEFLRTHRSYIVHMPKVESVERFRVIVGEEAIPVSDSYKEDVQNYFEKHLLV